MSREIFPWAKSLRQMDDYKLKTNRFDFYIINWVLAKFYFSIFTNEKMLCTFRNIALNVKFHL
jgi:hypothetical protein